MSDNNNSNRINELLTKLGESREDERNSQNQIVQVISTAGAVLGILFGASYFNSNTKQLRGLFILSNLVFCTAFSYIVVLGLGNVLRYHYIRDLENRLNRLMPYADDDKETNRCFFHWTSFYAPIITRNIKHLNSLPTIMNFFFYSLATISAIAFSVFLTCTQYMMIDHKIWLDHILFAIPLILMLSSAFAFVYISIKAKDTSEYCWKTAQKNRRKGEAEDNRYSIGKNILYFIYPKIQDIQKPGLIVLSFTIAMLLKKVSSEMIWESCDWSRVRYLVIFLFVFDFLAYQARYQINDIRGLREDSEGLANNRLQIHNKSNAAKIIKISFSIAVFKIVMALGIAFALNNIWKISLLGCLFSLLILTILYETARKKENNGWVYFLVGSGYPLRVAVGVLAAYPEVWKNPIYINNIQFSLSAKIILMFAFWAYGIYAGVLPWADEVSKRMQKGRESSENQFPTHYEKKHFMEIQKKIESRYIDAEQSQIQGRVLPLREKGKIDDVWNLAYLAAILFLALLLFKINPLEGSLAIFEGVFLGINFLICIRAYGKQIPLLTAVEVILIFVKGYTAWKYLTWRYVYFMILFIQFVFVITYFVLRYIPQMKKISLAKLFKCCAFAVVRIIVGEYAWKTLKSENLKSRKK